MTPAFGVTVVLKALAERVNAQHAADYPERRYCTDVPGYVCFVAQGTTNAEFKNWLMEHQYDPS